MEVFQNIPWADYEVLSPLYTKKKRRAGDGGWGGVEHSKGKCLKYFTLMGLTVLKINSAL